MTTQKNNRLTVWLSGIGHQLCQGIQRTGCQPHAAHLDPVTEQHDVNQRNQFPEEIHLSGQEQGGETVKEVDGNR